MADQRREFAGPEGLRGADLHRFVLLGHEPTGRALCRNAGARNAAAWCPGLLHAGNYCAANHWLKAVKAAGTTDADAVVAKMKAMPVNDFYNTNVKIREDGRVMHVMYLWQVKPVAQAQIEIRLSATSWRRFHRQMRGGR